MNDNPNDAKVNDSILDKELHRLAKHKECLAIMIDRLASHNNDLLGREESKPIDVVSDGAIPTPKAGIIGRIMDVIRELEELTDSLIIEVKRVETL